jgi:hypothetical protein
MDQQSNDPEPDKQQSNYKIIILSSISRAELQLAEEVTNLPISIIITTTTIIMR